MTEREVLLKPKEVEARFKFKIGTLANWRTAKKGPPYHKIGGRIYYDKSELLSWKERHRVDSEKP